MQSNLHQQASKFKGIFSNGKKKKNWITSGDAYGSWKCKYQLVSFLKIEYKIIEKCFIWFSVYGKFILFDFFICNINYIAEQSF